MNTPKEGLMWENKVRMGALTQGERERERETSMRITDTKQLSQWKTSNQQRTIAGDSHDPKKGANQQISHTYTGGAHNHSLGVLRRKKKVAETSLSLNRAWPSDGKNSHGRNSRAAAVTQDKEEMQIQRTSEDDTQRQEPPVTNALTYRAGNGRRRREEEGMCPCESTRLKQSHSWTQAANAQLNIRCWDYCNWIVASRLAKQPQMKRQEKPSSREAESKSAKSKSSHGTLNW